MKIPNMDRSSLELGLRGIRLQIQETQTQLMRLRSAESAHMQALKESEPSRASLPNERRRTPHGETRRIILEVLRLKGGSSWEGIRDHAQNNYNLPLARTTISDNLKSLKQEGLVDLKGTDRWQMTPSGMRESES